VVRLFDCQHPRPELQFWSQAVSVSASLPVIGALLGHKDTATTARYSHLQDDPVRRASNAIGQMVLDTMRSKGGAIEAGA
jgi:hypothetical protein